MLKVDKIENPKNIPNEPPIEPINDCDVITGISSLTSCSIDSKSILISNQEEFGV